MKKHHQIHYQYQVIHFQQKKINWYFLNRYYKFKINVTNYNKSKIYGIKKFGVSIKPDKLPQFPLQFIYHISKVKCKMLTENCIYILQIIFDKNEFPLTFSTGKNPKFIFEETFGKEIKFEDLENSFLRN